VVAQPARQQQRADTVHSLRLDPLNPLIYRAAGSVEYAARRYAESIPPLRKALDMNPKMGRAQLVTEG